MSEKINCFLFHKNLEDNIPWGNRRRTANYPPVVVTRPWFKRHLCLSPGRQRTIKATQGRGEENIPHKHTTADTKWKTLEFIIPTQKNKHTKKRREGGRGGKGEGPIYLARSEDSFEDLNKRPRDRHWNQRTSLTGLGKFNQVYDRVSLLCILGEISSRAFLPLSAKYLPPLPPRPPSVTKNSGKSSSRSASIMKPDRKNVDLDVINSEVII